MSILNRTLVVFAFVIIKLSIGDAAPVHGHRPQEMFKFPRRRTWRQFDQALETGGNKDYTVRMLLNLNHLFQTAETGAISEYEQIEETLSVLALDTVSNWILTHTRGDQLALGN